MSQSRPSAVEPKEENHDAGAIDPGNPHHLVAVDLAALGSPDFESWLRLGDGLDRIRRALVFVLIGGTEFPGLPEPDYVIEQEGAEILRNPGLTAVEECSSPGKSSSPIGSRWVSPKPVHQSICGEWEFNEWLHGRTGRPRGKAHQAWSAASHVHAYLTLHGDTDARFFPALNPVALA